MLTQSEVAKWPSIYAFPAGVLPFADARVPLLLLVVLAAAICSHSPRRFRHWSFLHKRVEGWRT